MATKEIIITEKDRQRFWSKVDVRGPDECWPWIAGCFDGGYGAFSIGGNNVPAHRIAWELSNGPIPNGLCACHLCDARYTLGDTTYRKCCNLRHLWLGTSDENMADMAKKGRSASGNRHGSRTHPERLSKGGEHYSRLHPELLARGDRNGARVHPELLPRGNAHYARTNPERLARGDRNGARAHPEAHPRGERHGMVKLTDADVLNIRHRYNTEKISQSQLAREAGVTQSAIWRIVNGLVWKHLLPSPSE